MKVKRIYETAGKTDGTRILVDRLWPRGVNKAKAKIDEWAKDVAPSTALRKWFHRDREGRWEEFQERYEKELSKKRVRLGKLKSGAGSSTITLVTAAKDPTHSHVEVLKKYLR